MPDGALSGVRVLLVEDAYDLDDALDAALRGAGAVMRGPTPSVEAALDLSRGEAPGAAVVDVNLGGEMAYPVADG